MNIGILTFHDGINFGAYAQVYALQKALENLGHHVRIINYKNSKLWMKEYKSFLYTLNLKTFINNVIKIVKFKKEHKKLNLTRFSFRPDIIDREEFDCVIVGSDEVWNFSSSFIGLDKNYFVPRDNVRTISYAASFGSSINGQNIPDIVANGINKFNQISVRDENSKKLINNITKRDVPIVLDPTFLHDFSEDVIPMKRKNYIVYYSVDLEQKYTDQIKQFAKQKNKKIIAIGYKVDWADENIYSIGPFEWMGLIRDADFIITSMFHGTIFSIKFNKQFCTLETKYRKNKMNPMMSILKLDNRIIQLNSSSTLYNEINDRYNNKINYDTVNVVINKNVKKSIDFLNDSI